MAAQYDDINGKLKDVKDEVSKINNLLFAVVIIMLLMVGFNLIEAWNNKGASYENLSNQINQQNIQLQRLNDGLQKK